MPLPLTVSCFNKIQIGFTFLVPAHLGSPGKRAVKRVCVAGIFVYCKLSRSDCLENDLLCTSDHCCVGLACALKLVCTTSRRRTMRTLWASCAVPAMHSAWSPEAWTSSTTCSSRFAGPSTVRKTCGSELSPDFIAPTASRSLHYPRHALSNSKLNVKEISYCCLLLSLFFRQSSFPR